MGNETTPEEPQGEIANLEKDFYRLFGGKSNIAIEDKLANVITTTRWLNIIGAIIYGIVRYMYTQEILVPVIQSLIWIMGTLALCILLEALTEIIVLLRKIADKE